MQAKRENRESSLGMPHTGTCQKLVLNVGGASVFVDTESGRQFGCGARLTLESAWSRAHQTTTFALRGNSESAFNPTREWIANEGVVVWSCLAICDRRREAIRQRGPKRRI